MTGRRREDRGTADEPAADDLPRVALGWLREIVRLECEAGPDFDGSLDASPPPSGATVRRCPLGATLEHALAAAYRGDAVDTVLLEFPDIESILREQGAILGEQAAGAAAGILRREARSSWLVVPYGERSFLVLLPSEGASEAEALVMRVRARLGGGVRLRAGIAEHRPGAESPEERVARARGALREVRAGARYQL